MGIKEQIHSIWEHSVVPVFDEFADDVELHMLDKGATAKDDIYDEAESIKQYLPPLSLKGRVKLGEDRTIRPGGEEIDADGKVTFKTNELEAAGIYLVMGTRVKCAQGIFEIVHIEKRAQVGDKYLLTRVYVKELL